VRCGNSTGAAVFSCKFYNKFRSNKKSVLWQSRGLLDCVATLSNDWLPLLENEVAQAPANEEAAVRAKGSNTGFSMVGPAHENLQRRSSVFRHENDVSCSRFCCKTSALQRVVDVLVAVGPLELHNHGARRCFSCLCSFLRNKHNPNV
jgi:hypothetical protein